MLFIVTGTNIDKYQNAIRFPENGVHPSTLENIARDILSTSIDEDIDPMCVVTYSPVLIEFFEVFAKYFEADDECVEIEFILDNGDNDYHRMYPGNLEKIYDNLAKPFDEIEVIKLHTEYKKLDAEYKKLYGDEEIDDLEF